MFRRFVAVLAAAGAAMSSPVAAQTVKVGLINSYTGFVAQAGDEGGKAFDLYLKLHEKELPPDVKLEIIKRDDTSNPEVGKRLAQELIAREHVQLLMGIVLSPVAAAIAPLTAEAKVPMLLCIASAGVQIPRLSPYIARVSFTLWQQGYPIGKWAAEQGWKKGYTAVSDFIPGHDSEASFTKGFTDGGGQIAGSVRMPPQNPDFVPFVQRIKDAKPDVAFFFVPADPQATALIKSMRDLGVREAGINVTAPQDVIKAATQLGAAEICNIYGGTEGYGNCCVTPHDWPLEQRASCQGPPLPGVQVRIGVAGPGRLGPAHGSRCAGAADLRRLAARAGACVAGRTPGRYLPRCLDMGRPADCRGPQGRARGGPLPPGGLRCPG